MLEINLLLSEFLYLFIQVDEDVLLMMVPKYLERMYSLMMAGS